MGGFEFWKLGEDSNMGKIKNHIEKGLKKVPGYVVGFDSKDNPQSLGSKEALENGEYATKEMNEVVQKKILPLIEKINSEMNDIYKKIESKKPILFQLEKELYVIESIIDSMKFSQEEYENRLNHKEYLEMMEETNQSLHIKKIEKSKKEKEIKKIRDEIIILLEKMKNLEDKLEN